MAGVFIETRTGRDSVPRAGTVVRLPSGSGVPYRPTHRSHAGRYREASQGKLCAACNALETCRRKPNASFAPACPRRPHTAFWLLGATLAAWIPGPRVPPLHARRMTRLHAVATSGLPVISRWNPQGRPNRQPRTAGQQGGERQGGRTGLPAPAGWRRRTRILVKKENLENRCARRTSRRVEETASRSSRHQRGRPAISRRRHR